MKSLTREQLATAFSSAVRGDIPRPPLELEGDELRTYLVSVGLLVPAGMRTQQVFEIDDAGRAEAARTIFFDEEPHVSEEVRTYVGADKGVRVVLDYLHETTVAERLALAAQHYARARAWSELFPWTREEA